jgi:hypothetical protein
MYEKEPSFGSVSGEHLYEPRLARKRVAAEQHPSENETDAHRSAYAPKRTQPAGTDRPPVEKDRDAFRSPYAPMKARGQPAAAPDFVISDDAEPTAPMRAGEANDRDLERLEASLHWLQREEAAARLPRATSLPPVPGLAPVDAAGRRHSSETLVDDLRAPSSLEPETLAPTPATRSRYGNVRWPLAIALTGIIAVPIAYYFSVGSWGLPPQPGPQIASFDQRFVAPQSKGTQKHRPTGAQDHDPETSAPMEMSAERTGISQTARSSEGESVAMLQGGVSGAQAPSSGKANRALDPEEIKLLTKQGEQFAAAGDLVTARILFQRAAEAGDPIAAMALGATYDPNVLAKLGVVGMVADVEKARSWYRKAESFGSPEASRRLNALANR